jgi:hypothetical protein
MTESIHTNSNLRNVGVLQIVNEPIKVESLISIFYPNAWNRIRAVENRLNIGARDRVHIQMMDEKWSHVDPKQHLPDEWYAAYDDHRYITFQFTLYGLINGV